jgi:hypothetical protein
VARPIVFICALTSRLIVSVAHARAACDLSIRSAVSLAICSFAAPGVVRSLANRLAVSGLMAPIAESIPRLTLSTFI